MKKVILLFILLPMLVSAQYFDVFDIDDSQYPIMKAKFISFDSNNKQSFNHNKNEYEITENGIIREILSISCSRELDLNPVSVSISFDISGSMALSSSIPQIEPIEIAKHSAKELVNLIEMPPSNISIQTTNSIATIIKDFTTRKDVILDLINEVKSDGSNDFGEQLLSSYTGLLNLAKNSKYDKIAIIYTDAIWYKLDDSQIYDCIQLCQNNNIRLFFVDISDSESSDEGVRQSLIQIANASGGKYYSKIVNEKKATEVAIDIARLNSISNPCEISWMSDYTCNSSIDLSIKSKKLGLRVNKEFEVNSLNTSKLAIKPYSITFDNSSPNVIKDSSFTVLSNHTDATIDRIELKSGDDIITIKEQFPILLEKGISKKINFSFKQIDEKAHYSVYDIISSNCSNKLNIYSGQNYGGINHKTLNLDFPNGGERLFGGLDTLVSWVGVTDLDSIILSFSSNNGRNWELLIDSNSKGSYLWKIPKYRSDSCLINIKQRAITNMKEGDIFWKHSFGGEENDFCNSIVETPDKGYIAVGEYSIGTAPNFNSDLYLLRLDINGKKIWEKHYGGSEADIGYKIKSLSNGGYLIVGSTTSNDRDVTRVPNDQDVWVLKINSLGSIEWEENFGGAAIDNGYSFVETQSGDIVIVGSNNNEASVWKINSLGVLLWQKSFNILSNCEAKEIIETVNNELIVVGSTTDQIGTKGFLLKLDNDGNKISQRITDHKINSVIRTFDDNYAYVGRSNNDNGNVWVEKVDSDFNTIWNRFFGAAEYDEANDLIEIDNGDILLTGESSSNSNGINRNFGYSDYFVIRLDKNGSRKWSAPYGGNRYEIANQLLLTSNGHYVIVGSSNTFYHDNIKDNHGENDFWLIKLNGINPYLQSDTSDAVFSIIMPDPVIQNNDIDMGQMIVGNTKDTVVSSVICNIGDAPLHVLGVDITGIDAGDYLIPRGASDFYLEKDSCQDMMFEFTPFALGNRTAVATIRTTIGDFQDTIHIRGVGINPVLEATANVVDFGVFEIGEGKDTTVILVKNVGCTDINITDTRISGPDMEQFTLKSSPLNYTIPAGEEKEYQLNYTAKLGGKSNSFLDFHYDGIGSPIRSLLFAEGIGGEVYPQVTDAYVGETVSIEIYLGKIKPEGLSEIATNFSATVSYNSTLLAPIDKSIRVTTEDNKSLIKIAGELSGVSQIAAVPMKVGLGTADRSGLVITEFQLYDANGDSVDYDIEPGVGEFNILGICEEGGKRLINPNGQAVDMVVTTDGLTGNARINLTLIETGQTELILFDQIGNVIETVYSGNPSAGLQEINLDLSKYTNGRYYLKLTTPTITKTEIIEVVR